MHQLVNKEYRPLFTEKPRYFFLMGGRGAGRSTVASQFALAKLTAPEYFRCAIMRYILGDVRNSIYREIIDRAEETGITSSIGVNDSMMVLKYGKNSINAVGFKKSSSDQSAKLKSLANYNYVIIEEADEIGEEDFMQLDDSLRTIKGDISIIFLFNPPPKSHWIIKRFFDLEPSGVPNFYIPKLKKEIDNAVFISTDYRVNINNLSAQIVRSYESYRNSKPEHYYQMIRGFIPETVIGKVYNGWKEIDEIPHEARLEARGVDFGWDPDPAVGIDIYYYNGGYIFDEIFYQTHMRNSDIGTVLLNQPQKRLTVADSAEPKSIEDIRLMGVNIIPCEKGKDSVKHGIGAIQDEQISYTKRSIHLKDEYENFATKIDKNGDPVPGEYVGKRHCLDAGRYGMMAILPVKRKQERIHDLMYNFKRYPKPKFNKAR